MTAPKRGSPSVFGTTSAAGIGSNSFSGTVVNSTPLAATAAGTSVANIFSGDVVSTGTISAPAIASTPATPSAGSVVASGSTSSFFDATPAQLRAAVNSTGVVQTGAGISVGVLSDSFNALGGAAADEQSGALPGAADIDVLRDGPSSGTDEGRAMMQIVHDIASGANLDFYSADYGEQQFAVGILALAAAGCKVICDDVSYFDEPFFQTDVIANAIETVEQEGVIYLTAAGNQANHGYQAAWDPIAATSYDGTALHDTQNFGGGKAVETIAINGSTSDAVPFVFEWNQPYGSVTSNLEVLVFKNGSLYGTATNAGGTGSISATDEPTNPVIIFDLAAGATYQIAIENLSGPNPTEIGEISEDDGGVTVSINVANAGTVVGHHADPDAITVGAVGAGFTPGNGGTLQSEPFSSSDLNTKLYFNYNGTTVTGAPVSLAPIAISGVDDIHTTLPVSDEDGALTDFHGTSAATPSVAAIVALMLQENPSLTFAEVKAELESTAVSFGNPDVAGAGLVNGTAAVQAAAQAPSAAAGHSGSAAYTNSRTTASVTVSGGLFSGSIGNTGEITSYGVAVLNSTITGQIFDGGYLYGGIGLDSNTSLTNPHGAAISITGATFFGNVSNGGTIATPTRTGIAVDGTATFQGGINNTGSISGAIGIAVDPAATFTGFVLNGPGAIISATSTGIAINQITSLFGGIENSGSLTAPIGINIADDSSFEGVINDNGGDLANTTAIRIAHSTISGSIYVNGTVDASHGISIDNASTITANPSSTAAIDITAATFMGGIVNNGTIDTPGSKTGIHILTNSTFLGSISNAGTISGGYGVVASDVAQFGSPGAGGITNAGTISASATYGSGILVEKGSTFAGSVVNSGSGMISALNNAIFAYSVALFTGNISNAGTLSALTGILLADVSDLSGGISNTGTITGNGIGIIASTIDGAIVDSGDIEASGFGITIDDTSVIDPAGGTAIAITGPTFLGGLTNAGVITAGTVAIDIQGASDFGGGITNTGAISGTIGIVLGDTPDVSLFDGGTIVGTGGTAIAFDADPNTLTLGSGYRITGAVSGGGHDAFQLGGSGDGMFNLAAIGAQYTGFSSFAVTGGNWTVSSSGPAQWSVSAGIMEAANAARLSNTIVSSGGLLEVLSGGIASSTVVSSGGTELVYGSGVSTTIMGGGVAYLESGGVGNGMALDGLAYVERGGTGSNTTASSGGALLVYGLTIDDTAGSSSRDYVESGGTADSMTVAGTGYIEAGGSASGTIIGSGGLVAMYGKSSATAIKSTGREAVEAGGTDSNATVSSGGTQLVYGSAIGTTVQSGGFGYVESGGVASGMVVGTGADTYVEHGGTDSNATVSSGGTRVAYGLTSGGTVDGGARDYVESGGIADGMAVAGTAYVEAGGSASGTTISSGGIVAMYGKASATGIAGHEADEAAGTDSKATVSSGGTELIYGSAVSTTILNGGFGYVESGGVGSATMVGSGGAEYVMHGGTDSSTTVSTSATQLIYGFGTGGTVSSGARDYVESGGTADGMAVAGAAYVEAGGSASGTTISSGGVVAMYGRTTATTIKSAGREAVEAGGTDSNATVSSGGTQLVYGSAVSTILVSGGMAEVASGGVASSTIISSGGRGYVEAGGKDSGATISSGGLDDVLSGGSELGLTVAAGGTAVLSSGAVVNGTLYASGTGGAIDIYSVVVGGGTAEIGNGIVDIEGSSSENVTFQSGGSGELELNVLGSAYSGKVSGFGQNTTQFIDLAEVDSTGAMLTYTPAAGNTSGTLTVTSGGISVSINMIGTYTSNSFTISHDPGNHVEIIDPPVVTQGGFGISAPLGYAGLTNQVGSMSTAGDNEVTNVPLLHQHMAAQFALVGYGENGQLGPTVLSGSTALLAHGHG